MSLFCAGNKERESIIMQSIKTKINTREYEMLTMGCLKSLKLASQIAEILKESSELTESNMQNIVFTLIGNEKFPSLLQELCETLTFSGRQIDFDTHFAEYKKDLLPCVGWAFKENVWPFFDPTALETLFGNLTADL